MKSETETVILSTLQNDLLNMLAHRSGFINKNRSGIKVNVNELWHNVDSTYEVELCFICGKEVANCFGRDNDIYKHGLEHIEESKLISFL